MCGSLNEFITATVKSYEEKFQENVTSHDQYAIFKSEMEATMDKKIQETMDAMKKYVDEKINEVTDNTSKMFDEFIRP